MKQSAAAICLLAALSSVQGFIAPNAVGNGAISKSFAKKCATTGFSAPALAMSTAVAEEEDLGIPDTPFSRRFGDLRYREVKPVSESVIAFCSLYTRPIIPQYRNIVNEIIQSTHLTVVDARFVYDKLFAYGLKGVFFKLLKQYPTGSADTVPMFEAVVKCLDLDPRRINADADEIEKWFEGKSESDLVEAFKGEGDSPLVPIIKGIQKDEFYLYSKIWATGLFLLFEKTGTEASDANVEKFIGPLGFPVIKAKQDLLQYRDVLDKLAYAEQLYKEVEIREKKRMAERLEAKAKKALEAAKRVEEQQAAASSA